MITKKEKIKQNISMIFNILSGIKTPLFYFQSQKRKINIQIMSFPSILDNNLCYKVATPIILDVHNMEGHLVIYTQKVLGILPLCTHAPDNTDALR